MTNFIKPKQINLITLLHNEENNELEKIATEYNDDDLVSIVHKAYPKTLVGGAALRRVFHYEDSIDPTRITGQQVSVTAWTQIYENLANPPITALALSENIVEEGSPVGTVVGTLTPTGGSVPFIYEITADPSSKFQLSGNELQLADSVLASESPYSVTIKVTDSNNLAFSQIFSINTVLFMNTKSVLFDGVNETINCGTDSTLDLERTDTFSISTWFKISNVTASRELCGKVNSVSNGGYECFLLQTTGELRFSLRNTGGNRLLVETNNTFDDGVWHHVVFTYDGSSTAAGVTIYVDGSSEALTTVIDALSASISVVNNFYIGSRNATANFCLGNIDELSIYDEELTSGEVTAIYNSGSPNNLSLLASSSKLISWWRMGDEDTFPTITDNIASNDGNMLNMESGDIVVDAP